MVLPMARDLGKFGIRVVAIAPGFFDTPMTDSVKTKREERYKAIEMSSP
jgi:NAD(P)-dependent dehydrogenase (short-subunit alcohol dehydrogenase family)